MIATPVSTSRSCERSTSQIPSRSRTASSGPETTDDERTCAGDGSGDVPSARGGDDDGEVAETACPCPVDQVERVPVVGGEERRRAPRERRGDGRLVAGLDLEGREREALAFLGERARGGRDALALGQRALERRESLARRSRPLGEVVPLACRGSRLEASGVGASFELGRIRPAAPRVGASGLVALRQLARELGRCFVPSAQPLACGSQRDERPMRGSVHACQLRKPAVERLALSEDRLETPLRLLGGRSLARREHRVCVTRALGSLPAFAGGVARGCARLAGGALERLQRLVRARLAGPPRLGEVGLEPAGHDPRRFAANRESLACSLESVERAEGGLPGAGRVGELQLDRFAVCEHAREPLLRRSAGERRRLTPLVGLGAPCLDAREIEPRDAGAEAGDLDDELLGPLRGRCLERERPQALAHLVLDVLRALDLGGDAGQLQLGAVPAPLELPEPGGLLDERPAVGGLRREHGVDLPLADDRVHRPAESDVRQQLDEVGAAHGRAVDEVLTLSAAHEAAHDRDLAVVELVAEAAVLVVEDELDLAVIGRAAARGAAEEDVVGLLRPELRGRERAGRPDDRVGDVRLARAVRADDDGHARLEADLDRIGERLEAAQLDGAQVHRRRSIASAADVAWGLAP